VIIDPSAPATGEIIFRLIKSQGLPFDHDIAENLFAAISTDTGSFQYPKTSARTFEIAAGVGARGDLDVGKISQQLYENYPRRRLELLRELLRTMRFSECGRIATFGLSLKNAAELGVIPEDNEGLIDHLRAVHGVIVAVFFEELSDGKVRVSMRSKDERWMYARFARNLAAAGTHSLPVRACAERWRKSKKKFWRKLVKPLSALRLLTASCSWIKPRDDVARRCRAGATTTWNEKDWPLRHARSDRHGPASAHCGRGTKVQDLLMSEDKEYVGTFVLGVTTAHRTVKAK
jgi:Exopolyphosphatase-related proteins